MERPDLIAAGEGRLSRTERLLIRFVRRTIDPGWLDQALRFLQRNVGAPWIHLCTRHLLSVHGVDRLPSFDPDKSYICVANHRSFFDLYVITCYLTRRGMRHRQIFPVRSDFFYTRPIGLIVNGLMSFFAMYPPVFRSREKLRLNVTSLADLAWLTTRGGAFVGFHPEGTRNKGDDPYTLLKPQRGVGQLVHATDAQVIPVFINGLRTSGLRQQVVGNFTRRGETINVVFGEPIDFSDLRELKPSMKTQTQIAQRAMEAIRTLGEEERELRRAAD